MLQSLENPEALPGMVWLTGDDKCDCTYQRIGKWTNPFLAETLEYRWCCIWAELEKLLPSIGQFVRVTNGYWDENRSAWALHPREWDGEDADMPTYLWFRQLAKQTGKPLAQIREEYKDRLSERPKATPYFKGKHDKPTRAERIRALEARMKASGWLIGNEKPKDDVGDE